MGDSNFSLALFFGVSLVIASVFLYTLYPTKVKSPTPEVPNKEQTQNLLNDFDKSENECDEDEEDESGVTNGQQCKIQENVSLFLKI